MAEDTIEQRGTDSRQRLVDWANEQDHWVRAIVGEILSTRQALSERAINKAYAILLAEKQLSAEVLKPIPLLGTQNAATESAETLRLNRLHAVRHVNALTKDQELTFNERLTICFGENAAGKTGYVRIFKRLAGVRSAEPILQDIHGTSSSTPEATIRYAHAGTESNYEWKDETGVTPFTRISIFDSRTAALHVDEDLNYLYTPSDLALFRHAHDAINHIKDRLEKARDEATPVGNPFLARFNRDTILYPKIESLGAATDPAELERLGTVTPDEMESLAILRERVDALRPEASQARLRLARTDHATFTALQAAARTTESFPWTKYEDALTVLRTTTEQVENATKKAFTEGEVPGGFTDEWKAFIAASEEYLQSLDRNDYPHASDDCIFCRQPLGKTAIALLKKYRHFNSGTLREDLDAARKDVETITQPLLQFNLEGLRTTLDQRANGAPPTPLLTDGRNLVTDLLTSQDLLRQREPAPPNDLSARARSVTALATAQIAQADELITTLSREATEREQLFDAESAKVRALEARITLKALLPDVKAYVDRARWALTANTISSTRFPVILRSLTDESKLASEQVLNHDFETRFSQECTALRAPKVSLDFPGRRGEPTRRKKLDDDHQLSEILSEGEQKAIALADFLAEASLRRHSAPILFDDPVSSFDHKRMRYVADRLYEISAENQVIVFTHDIWFVVELIAHFETTPTECTYYEICQEDGGIGIVHDAPAGPKWDTPKAISKRINTVIQEAATATGEARAALIERGYSLIRSWCETFIEQEALCSVTQRFQPHVMMTKLVQIKTDRLPAVFDAIIPIFEKACRLTEAHSQPLQTLGTRATLDDLKEDWKKLQDARTAYVN
jgi:hypothetical protein